MLQTESDCLNHVHSLGLSEPYTTIASLERAGWVKRKIPNPETVAQHSIRSALLAVEFQDEVRKRGLDILEIQTYLLIHDLQEGNPLVGDITPHDNVPKDEMRRREEAAIIEILGEDSPLLDIWYRGEMEGSIGKEIEKYQAIEQAAIYEKIHPHVAGVTEQFARYTVNNGYVLSDFLLARIKKILTDIDSYNYISKSTLSVSKQLHKVPRIWNDEETVGEHTEETIGLALEYIAIIKKYGGNPDRVRALLRVHDIPEFLTGDMDPRHTCPKFKNTIEEWSMSLLIGNEPDKQLWYEYSLGETIDAQFAKAFDKLQFLKKLESTPWADEYWKAMNHYRKYLEPFPEFLRIVDNPNF